MAQKLSIPFFIAIALTGAGAVSCTNENPTPEIPVTPLYEQGFSMGTRADGSGDPEHGDAYTIVSYRVGGTNSTEMDKYTINFTSRYGRQWGYYAYDDGLLSGRPAGTLVPVEIQFPNIAGTVPNYTPLKGIAPLESNGSEAQMLNSVPSSGPDPDTNQGVYRTAVIHPAIPMHNASTLGFLGVFSIEDKVFASLPDDANGDGITDDPFEITVTHNDQVHPIHDPTELFPVRAAVKVWFYSEYYYDDDPGQTNPQQQSFTINSLNLYNVGSNGWYNARTTIVYPNYNFGSNFRISYSFTEVGLGTPESRPNFRNLLADVTEDGETPGPGKNKYPFQYSVETPVFPSDYRGYENGGLFEVQPLILQVVLDMNGGGQNKVSVPLALKMERGKRYHFYVNVLSEVIEIKYNISPWETGSDDDEPIGGNMIDYKTITLEYTPGSWDNVGSNNEIGN